MRIYEELFIMRPDATEEEIDGYVGQLKTLITGAAGVVDKVDKWGVRKLAYRVHKRAEGYYILIQFQSGAELVRELERRLRVSDLVLKFLTVRIDEKLKRLEKRKKTREKRAARKPPPSSAPAPAPAPASAPAAASDHPAPGVPTTAEM